MKDQHNLVEGGILFISMIGFPVLGLLGGVRNTPASGFQQSNLVESRYSGSPFGRVAHQILYGLGMVRAAG